MLITDVKKAKKHLIDVEIDGDIYKIDEEAFIASRLFTGSEISEAGLAALMYKSDLIRAKNKALWLLSHRDYSKKEMLGKLKPDFDADAAAEAIELLSECGMIDDERFARVYANDLVNLKGLSKRGVVMELIKKGIDRETAAIVAEETAIDETETIKEIIRVRYYNCLDDEKGKRRMFSGLARKGYSYNAVKHALEEYLEENDVY